MSCKGTFVRKRGDSAETSLLSIRRKATLLKGQWVGSSAEHPSEVRGWVFSSQQAGSVGLWLLGFWHLVEPFVEKTHKGLSEKMMNQVLSMLSWGCLWGQQVVASLTENMAASGGDAVREVWAWGWSSVRSRWGSGTERRVNQSLRNNDEKES